MDITQEKCNLCLMLSCGLELVNSDIDVNIMLRKSIMTNLKHTAISLHYNKCQFRAWIISTSFDFSQGRTKHELAISGPRSRLFSYHLHGQDHSCWVLASMHVSPFSGLMFAQKLIYPG